MGAFEQFRDDWYWSPDGGDYEFFLQGILDDAEEDDYYYGMDFDEAVSNRVEYCLYLEQEPDYRSYEDSLDVEAEIEFVIGIYLGFDKYFNPDDCLSDSFRRDALSEHQDCVSLAVLTMHSLGMHPEAFALMSEITGFQNLNDCLDDALTDGSFLFGQQYAIKIVEDFLNALPAVVSSGYATEEDAVSMCLSACSAAISFGEGDLGMDMLASACGDFPGLETYYDAYIAGVPIEDIFI